eukprot:6246007-Amphidinium_carterae.1
MGPRVPVPVAAIRPATICRVRDVCHGTSQAIVRALVTRVARGWVKNDRWSIKAVRAIGLVAKAAGPASSAAYAKLLVTLKSVPTRCGLDARLCP